MADARTRRRAIAALALAGIAIVAAGCGGSEASEPPEAPAPKPITNAQASLVTAGLSKDAVIDLLKADPALTQRPFRGFPGGCIYYPMKGRPLSSAWQFCFNQDGVSLVQTQYSSAGRPPADASPARELLLARADTVCQSQYAALKPITDGVAAALDDYNRRRTAANRVAVGAAIRRFIANLEETHEALAAFDAPEDASSVYDDYLDSLESQIDTLRQARAALLEQDEQTYTELGDEFTATGEQAKQQAKEYGLSYCSASSFG